MTTDGVKEYVGMDNWETYLRCPKYERQQFPGSCYRVDDEIYALIVKNGYQIKFANVSEKEMIKASQASFLRDYTLMEKLLAEAIQ